MKRPSHTLALGVFVSLILTACGGDSGGTGMGNGSAALTVDSNGVSSFNGTVLGSSLASLAKEDLNSKEQESLAFMREEEKLAHDVYAYLDSLYRYINVFGNIANSESTHTEAVRQLLVRYEQSDPASNLAAGVYANATLQGLYTQLVTRGMSSVTEALKVGAAIEEIDIMDIQNALPAIDNQDIRLVYDSLLKGSRNHLRAFTKSLKQQGVIYVPQYLPVDQYNVIVNSAIERG
jgi:hypothetical protein